MCLHKRIKFSILVQLTKSLPVNQRVLGSKQTAGGTFQVKVKKDPEEVSSVHFLPQLLPDPLSSSNSLFLPKIEATEIDKQLL